LITGPVRIEFVDERSGQRINAGVFPDVSLLGPTLQAPTGDLALYSSAGWQTLSPPQHWPVVKFTAPDSAA
jgi:hypothetical protein